ncbi:hypothetical protein L3X38_009521 [Prunus dulcis]|uniref:Uncharacterized protein n=1 Tax=Prunus dulcis TaxID=3755 RepID=A0AAD4ZDI8_PRUDU|nr:hypothetical protein L3X38_009521 [Prunus dulcis]
MVGHSAFEDQGNGSPNDFRNLFKDIFDNDIFIIFRHNLVVKISKGCAKTVTFPAAVACEGWKWCSSWHQT